MKAHFMKFIIAKYEALRTNSAPVRPFEKLIRCLERVVVVDSEGHAVECL